MLTLFRNVWKLLRHPNVHFSTKLIFVLGVLIYGISPDLLPYMPFDDIVVFWLASRIFVSVGSREAGIAKDNVFEMFRQKDKNKDVIDAEGEFVEEE